MLCRRCQSADLLALEVFQPQDNRVYRCRPCGFLFSPGPAAAATSPEKERETAAARERKPAGAKPAAAARERKPSDSSRSTPNRRRRDA